MGITAFFNSPTTPCPPAEAAAAADAGADRCIGRQLDSGMWVRAALPPAEDDEGRRYLIGMSRPGERVVNYEVIDAATMSTQLKSLDPAAS